MLQVRNTTRPEINHKGQHYIATNATFRTHKFIEKTAFYEASEDFAAS